MRNIRENKRKYKKKLSESHVNREKCEKLKVSEKVTEKGLNGKEK
jgi:hypothetical protein